MRARKGARKEGNFGDLFIGNVIGTLTFLQSCGTLPVQGQRRGDFSDRCLDYTRSLGAFPCLAEEAPSVVMWFTPLILVGHW